LAERGFANSHIAMLGSFSQRFAQRRHRTRWRVGREAVEARRGSSSSLAEEEEKEGERGDEALEEGGGGGGGACVAGLVEGRLERAILERAILVAAMEGSLGLKLEGQNSGRRRALYASDPFAVRF
jgi:hypothetical protein